MTNEEKIEELCTQIETKIIMIFSTLEETLKTSQERARTAEEVLEKIKTATTSEIRNAWNLGFQEGQKVLINNDDSGGTQKDKDVQKLVLEN